MSFDSTLVILGHASAVIGVLAAIYGIAAYFVKRHKNRPHWKRIISQKDSRWEGIRLIHEQYFTPDTCDDIEDVRAWIDSWSSKQKSVKTDLEEVLITASSKGHVIGYFYGQYYRSFGMLFAAYFAIDRASAEAGKRASVLLGEGLQTELSKYDSFTGIVAELEDIPDTNHRLADGTRSGLSKASARFKTFNRLVRNLDRSTPGTQRCLYRIEADYHQPHLRESDIQVLPTDGSKTPRFVSSRTRPDLKQWLIWIPNAPCSPTMPKAEASHIFEFIFQKVYRDAFPESEIYASYLAFELKAHIDALPNGVPLSRHC